MLASSPFIETFDVAGAGPRVAIKDCLDIAGWPTRMGSAVFEDAAPATADAAVVAALRRAGGRIVGKAKMHEFAFGVTGLSGPQPPVNPDFPDRIPGGSSSGSAVAVASGLVDYAIGTDTGGSIRVPAACCGVFGLKPTFGRVSRAGAWPQDSSLDCVGPLAASPAGLIAAMRAIDPSFVPVPSADFSLGRVATSADPEIESAVDLAVRQCGRPVVNVALHGLEAAFAAGVTLIAREAWTAFGAYAEDPRLGSDVAARLRGAARITDAQVAQARQAQAAFRREVDAILETVTFLVLPTMPRPPLRLDEAADARALLSITALARPFNVSGYPAASIPLRAPGDLPVGLQLVGRCGDDARLCAAVDVIAGRASDAITRAFRKEEAQ